MDFTFGNTNLGIRMKTLMILGGAVVAGVAVFVAAPVVLPMLGVAGLLGAAGTGTAISSLSGAALTSASCAAVTGTIAGTTAVLGSAGAAVGAAVGALVKKQRALSETAGM
ncbi:MAG: hypothetical protein NTV22_01715 [bacterium]|nr:hypothetical protein [bacterium]